ncbi:CPBP family intramembrane glutamic endopeptidase [Microbulbifer litoralis]|uniref:CPBP family intramembrane glutamic endopeptidase n=1 Tax=Microbulbifer litoralis TaxID=2933965 RepID=UPI0020291D8A
MTGPAMKDPDTFGLAMGIQLVTLFIALACLYFVDVAVSWWGGGAFESLALGLLGAALSYAAILALTRSPTALGERLRVLCGALHPFFRHFSWPQIAATALAAGVCEELLFRGFLQPWLQGFTSPLTAVLVTSLAFGLLHYASFTYFAITTAIGVILGLAYWFSDSLVLVITWHATYDLFAIVALAKYPRSLGIPVSEESVR